MRLRYNIKNILIFLVAGVMICSIFDRSMLSSKLGLGGALENIITLLIILMFLISIIFSGHTRNEWLWLFCGLIIGIMIYHYIHAREYILFVLELFSLNQFSPKLFLKISIISITIGLALLYVMVILGLIPNTVYFRDYIVRYSLGTQHPLIFSGYIFLMSVAITFLNLNSERNKKILCSIILVFLIFLLSCFTKARNDELSILFCLIVLWVDKIKKQVLQKITFILSILFPLLIVFSIFITNVLSYNSNSYPFWNWLFSGRLNMQNELLQNYSIPLWGQDIPQTGGFSTSLMHYFYIDNSYARFLFMGGIIFFVFIILTIMIKILQLNNKKLGVLAIMMLIIGLNGIFSDNFSIFYSSLLMPLYFISSDKYIAEFDNDHKM